MMAPMTDSPDPADAPGSAPEPPPPADTRRLPPDPAKYDAPRSVAARRRGLDAPYIAGGEDPELGDTLRRERRYVRLLVAMIVGIVLLGFALGILGALIGAVRA